MGEPEFFLLYAKKDDSFCVVSCSDVIFECPVAVNDQVKFMYTQDGVKKQYAGVVKEFGDDFKTLVDRLPYWNKTRQKPKVPSARRKSRQSKQSRQPKKVQSLSATELKSVVLMSCCGLCVVFQPHSYLIFVLGRSQLSQ
ncbi:uncharacterized protein LOC127750790 [Frankliniella occidentalis]|uniref:Uncharacterized protein LOC127750790 n=1 Tax=Frankliniella occidentalis TaxID=133901 RepID=A0A9C6XSC3_FRAOC|nr:uncharacterized protein LOC127750790 [Frankliniella occidentalis]